MKISPILCVAVLLMGSATAFAAKPVIGVAEFENQTAAAWWRGGVGWELSSMVTNELANNGKFKVVERSKLEPVLSEQDLAASGRIAQGTGAKIGKLTGAQYLVLGTISAYEENTASTGGGISISGISIGGKKKQAYIAADLRVVNTTTGEIDHARTVEARTGGFGLKLGVFRGKFGGRLAQQNKTPAGKAIRAMLVEIVDYLECVMVVQGNCIAEFDAKEQKRKKSLKDTISLD
ncbi:MAG: CsgG/HfaB family protein [Gammaproteobacteria bacterium]|nr:CsgG/HfaB family protein [Gammaproteobacteria bacterium]MDH3466395.1 CsgG/HfaB family protein [Gammaproteobacteria bacterium]